MSMARDEELAKIRAALQGSARFKVDCQDCGKEFTAYVWPSAPALECPGCHGRNTLRHRIGSGLTPDAITPVEN
jgi:ribosomal protein S27E